MRSATALAGGLVREIGVVAFPGALRRTLLYRTLVDNTLRFLIEKVGEVEGAYPSEGKLAEDFLMRRAAGNGLEFIGILAFRASPVWVMAALADLSGAGKHLIREITDSLKKEGLLQADTQFETVDQMLDGLEATAGKVAETINNPPLDVKALRQEWNQIRVEAAKIPPRNLPPMHLLEKQWSDLVATAEAQKRSVFEVSALVGLSAIRGLPDSLIWLSRCAHRAAMRTGELMAWGLLDHYQSALADVRKQGFVSYWRTEFRPYLKAAAEQFSPKRRSLTQRLMGK